jgi:DNA-binding MarR family transcriptional regulator
MGEVGREAARAANSRAVRDFGLLMDAAGRLERRVDAALRARCGVHHTMFEVLVLLCRTPGEQVSQRDLGEKLVLTSGGTTRLVDRMEEAGLVRRSPSSVDRRVTTVEATDKGRAVFVTAATVHAEVVEQYFVAPVAPDDHAVLVRVLADIGAAVASGSFV